MTRKTYEELRAQSDGTIVDNTTELITPAVMRNMINDLIEALTPIYAGLTIGSVGLSKALTATPALFTLQNVVGQFPPEWTVTTSQITRALAGAVGCNTRHTIQGTVEGPSGAEVTITLYKNGSPTVWTASITTGGTGKPQSFNLVALDYGTVDAAFELRASVEGTNSTHLFKNFAWIAENVPIRTASPALFMA